MKKILAIFVLAALVALAPAVSHASERAGGDRTEARILAFGYSDNPELSRFLEAAAASLAKKCGMRPEIIVKKTHAEVEFELITGGFDIAILPPQLFLVNLGKVEFSPIAVYCYGEDLYRSALFSTKYKTMAEAAKDTATKKVLFVDPFSASGFVVPYVGIREELAQEELQKINFAGFSGSHAESLAALLGGRADIIASYSSLLSDYRDTARGVNMIREFPMNIPNDIIVVSNGFWNGLSVASRGRLLSAITSIRSGGRRLSRKYAPRHVEEYYCVSKSIENGSDTGEIGICVPEGVIIEMARKARGVTDVMRLIERKARLTLGAEKSRGFRIRIIDSFDSCMWNLIAGESRYAYLGGGTESGGAGGFPAEWTGRFPMLRESGSGFYGFEAPDAGK